MILPSFSELEFFVLHTQSVLHWLTGMEGLEDADEIEDLNHSLLKKVLDESDNIAVLFCKSNNIMDVFKSS